MNLMRKRCPQEVEADHHPRTLVLKQMYYVKHLLSKQIRSLSSDDSESPSYLIQNGPMLDIRFVELTQLEINDLAKSFYSCDNNR